MSEPQELDTLTALPWEVQEYIFSCLSAEDLGRLCCVCRYLSDTIVWCNNLWKPHCKAVWLCKQLDKDCVTWYGQWRKKLVEYGRYKDCYAEVKQAWNLIEDFLGHHFCQASDDWHGDLSSYIRGGLSEDEISAAEAELGFSLPNDLRCSLRIHDGQNIPNPASILGGLQFYSYSTVLLLFPLQLMVQFYCQKSGSGYNPWKNNQQYLQLASGLSGEFTFLLSLAGCKFTAPGNVVQATLVDWHRYRVPLSHMQDFPHSQVIPNYSVGIIGEAKCFTVWLMEHAKLLPHYPVLENKLILRFYYNPDWEATTGHFTISVGTALDPTLGRWNHGHVLFSHAIPLLMKGGSYAYWIRIQMNKDAPASESCRLLSRHWVVKYASGREERVDGEGVIGENPVFTPGKVYQYASCTNFIDEEYCTMEGHYTMKYLNRPDRSFFIRIPRFYMPLPKVVWV